MSEEVWIALIAGLFGGSFLPRLFDFLTQLRKGKVDIADTYQEIAGQAAKDLKDTLEETKRQREEIKGLTARITILEREKLDWECERGKLIQQNIDLQKEVQELRMLVEQLQQGMGKDN